MASSLNAPKPWEVIGPNSLNKKSIGNLFIKQENTPPFIYYFISWKPGHLEAPAIARFHVPRHIQVTEVTMLLC
jgi:hypothetical protein